MELYVTRVPIEDYTKYLLEKDILNIINEHPKISDGELFRALLMLNTKGKASEIGVKRIDANKERLGNERVYVTRCGGPNDEIYSVTRARKIASACGVPKHELYHRIPASTISTCQNELQNFLIVAEAERKIQVKVGECRRYLPIES
ncbi:MAG: hypothetical protein PHU12_02060 [Candidatus Aenigmarchaeota archaeon]|nr:hypothetical protein [Candidatus Aenigmarchaeota archaeon]